MEWYEAFKSWAGTSAATPLYETDDEDEHAYICRIFDKAVREAFHAGWELKDTNDKGQRPSG